MKFRLRIYPAAAADVDDAALYIARDSMDAALRFYDSVDQTYRQIREHPTRWPRYELDHPKLANQCGAACTPPLILNGGMNPALHLVTASQEVAAGICACSRTPIWICSLHRQ